LTLYLGPRLLYSESHLAIIEEQNPIAAFSYALKAPETKRQFPVALKCSLTFIIIVLTSKLALGQLLNHVFV
jgi:hypothetical protein